MFYKSIEKDMMSSQVGNIKPIDAIMTDHNSGLEMSSKLQQCLYVQNV